MSKLTIVEIHTGGRGAAVLQHLPPAESIDPQAVPKALGPGAAVVNVQAVPIGSGDPVSAPFSAAVDVLLLIPEAPCAVSFGHSPIPQRNGVHIGVPTYLEVTGARLAVWPGKVTFEVPPPAPTIEERIAALESGRVAAVRPSKAGNPHADGLWPVGYHSSYDKSRRIPGSNP